VAFQFDVPLTQLKPGTYVCQVNVIDDAGGKLRLSTDGDEDTARSNAGSRSCGWQFCSGVADTLGLLT